MAEPGSKNKLSKRKLDKYLKNRDFALVNEHGLAIAKALGLETAADTFNPVIVDFYEQVGYLPDAIINYLVLLGWSLDDKTEIPHARADDRQFFAGARHQGPGQLRPQEAVGLSGPLHAAAAAQAEGGQDAALFAAAGLVPTPAPCEVGPKLTRIVEAAGDRLKVFGDILAYADFFFPDEKAFDKNLRKLGAAELLAKFRAVLAEVEPFDVPHLETGAARLRRRAGHQDRRHHSRHPRGRHRQSGRRGALRLPGDPRQRRVPEADRPKHSFEL